MDIVFNFDTDGIAHEDAFLDAYELSLLFDQTRHDIESGLRRKLHQVVCADHEQPPRITISGRYDHETEQMDIQYHIDTCCQMFLVRVVKILNMQS
jgi:hypothetical protein